VIIEVGTIDPSKCHCHDNIISVIDGRDNNKVIGKPIPIGSSPSAIGIDQIMNNRIYVTNQGDSFRKKRFRSSKKHKSDNENGLEADTGLNRNLEQPELDEGNEQIIDRRIRGGISITAEEIAELYVQAQQQWLKLPGSIIRPPTDIILIQKYSKSQGQGIISSEQTHHNTDNGAIDFES